MAVMHAHIAFHSEMSNHIHLVLRTRPDVAATWSDEEVVQRWLKIAQLKRGRRDEPSEPSEARVRYELGQGRVAQLRGRLADVSWFMGALCENIARRCNSEDGCSGKFWEARYSCRNLAEESAILICGIYVDLNPIRAGEARMPEQARHSSAYDRIEGRKWRLFAARTATSEIGGDRPSLGKTIPKFDEMPPDGWLCELTLASGAEADVRLGAASATTWRASDKGILPVSLDEYLKLLDWTETATEKRGAIPAELAPILDRLRINSSAWLESVDHFEKRFGRIVASATRLADRAAAAGVRWFRGVRAAAETFLCN
jgi:hypothetical protein